jgi:hypothetical protein
MDRLRPLQNHFVQSAEHCSARTVEFFRRSNAPRSSLFLALVKNFFTEQKATGRPSGGAAQKNSPVKKAL